MRKSVASPPTREVVQAAFGVAIKELRAARDMTQEELAAGADMHFTYVSSVERGQRNLSLYNVHRLALALGVPPSALLQRSEQVLRTWRPNW